MNAIVTWWQMLPWSTAALVVAILIAVASIGFLAIDGYQHRRRFNRRTRIRVSQGELDHAILTGQFYTPRPMLDKKGITKC